MSFFTSIALFSLSPRESIDPFYFISEKIRKNLRGEKKNVYIHTINISGLLVGRTEGFDLNFSPLLCVPVCERWASKWERA